LLISLFTSAPVRTIKLGLDSIGKSDRGIKTGQNRGEFIKRKQDIQYAVALVTRVL
jgi:hypothetical protein